MRRWCLSVIALSAALAQSTAGQAPDSAGRSNTFLNRRDIGIVGAAVAGTVLLSVFDDDIARASQETRFQGSNLRTFTTRASKVNETTLTLAGIAVYGIGRLTHSPVVTDIALHATESVVLASVASQLIRGPLGRTRPYVTSNTAPGAPLGCTSTATTKAPCDQYSFHPFKGFFGENSFDYRAFPSIHTSSSMAVATVLAMETHRRSPAATPFVAPLIYAAALLPGLSRVELNQHWASDIAAGAFMGVFAGYKVVSYSHAHPNNRFDRMLLSAQLTPGADGSLVVAFSPF